MPPITAAARSAARNDSPYAQVGATLVDNGYSAIPCMPQSKIPGQMHFKDWHAMLGWNRYCDRLPTHYETRPWSTWPDAGVCMALDKVVKVVDIDTDDPELRAAITSVLPDSPVKKRGLKGFSIFYRGSEAIESRSFTVRGERVLDLLAHGKQTVLPPTIHPTTGRPYVWVEGGDTLVDTTPDQLPELPDDIVEKLTEALAPFGYAPPKPHDPVLGDSGTAWREVNNIAMARLSDWVPSLGLPRTTPTPNGYRAVAGYRPSGSGKPTQYRNLHVSFHSDGIVDWGDDDRRYTPIDMAMVARSLPFDDAFEWLRDKLGLKPKKHDFTKLVANIKKRQAEQEAAKLKLPDDFEQQDDEEAAANDNGLSVEIKQPVRAPIGAVDPFDHRRQGGLLGSISQWALASAWSPIPQFATLTAIAACAAMFGRRYLTPTGLGLNLYMIGLGDSGFGKEHTLNALQALLGDAKLQHLVGPGDFASDSALEHKLRQSPCIVLPMDEVGVFLQATSGRNAGGYEKRIRKVLLELYSKGNSRWTGKQRVPQPGAKLTDNSSEPIFNPTLTICGMSTPSEFYKGITEQNLTDGVIGRMTMFAPAVRGAPRDERASPNPPNALVGEVKRVMELYPVELGNLQTNNWRLPGLKPLLHQVAWESRDVRARWKEIEDWQLALIDENPDQQGIVGRAAEQTQKLATIRAISRSPDNPVVRGDDVEWGWAIVSASLQSIDDGVATHLVSGDFDALVKLIVFHLKAKGGSLPRSELLRQRGMVKDPRLMDAALKHLIQADIIHPVPPGKRVRITLLSEAEQAQAA